MHTLVVVHNALLAIKQILISKAECFKLKFTAASNMDFKCDFEISPSKYRDKNDDVHFWHLLKISIDIIICIFSNVMARLLQILGIILHTGGGGGNLKKLMMHSN